MLYVEEMDECPYCGADVRPWEACECENEFPDDLDDLGYCNVCDRPTATYDLNDWGECPRCQEEDRHAN